MAKTSDPAPVAGAAADPSAACWVGVDVAKASVEVVARLGAGDEQHWRGANDDSGYVALLA